MGFFSFFKKAEKVIVNDEVFGALQCIDDKDSSNCFFEGKVFFAPTNSNPDLHIKAPKEGPTEQQRQFYIGLQKNFSSYRDKIKIVIEDEFRNWKEDFEIKDFNKEFQLVFIIIPHLDKKPLLWEMSFTSSHDLNHHFTVDFTDDEPNGVLIDG